ncbi:MAG: hypothetical protein K8R02_07595 [Anaerohalosphaeraceae bacterium]|nr:hypothetical protein [Anaerohalosphaeraceae bacterium]
MTESYADGIENMQIPPGQDPGANGLAMTTRPPPAMQGVKRWWERDKRDGSTNPQALQGAKRRWERVGPGLAVSLVPAVFTTKYA